MCRILFLSVIIVVFKIVLPLNLTILNMRVVDLCTSAHYEKVKGVSNHSGILYDEHKNINSELCFEDLFFKSLYTLKEKKSE